MDRTLSTISIEDAEAILGSARRTALLATQHPFGNVTRETIRKEYLSLIRLADEAGISELSITAHKLRTALASDMHEVAAAVCLLDAVVQFESVVFHYRFESEVGEHEILEAIERSFRAFGSSPNEIPIGDNDVLGILEDGFEFDPDLFEIFTDEAEELLTSFDSELEKLKFNPNDSEALWDLKRIIHTFKGAAGAVGLRHASEIAHSIEDDLEYAPVELNSSVVTFVESLSTKIAEIKRIVAEATSVAEAFSDSPDHSMVRPGLTPNINSPESFEGLKDETAESKITRKPVIRISIDALDHLQQKAEDLANGITEIFDLPENSTALLHERDRALLTHLQNLCELSSTLQNDIYSIRMVEFGILTTRLQRAVRVACDDGSKTAEILIDNPGVRFDTLDLDALVEPLMHLLRNAVVHGIEPPDSRRLMGKPENGIIRITLKEDETGWTVEVSDDGRGIDLNSLRSKAIQMGVITQASAKTLSETATADLIFEKGLSTADQLSMLAGRGVGMGIIREAIQGLNGTLEIHSRNTIGTSFTIKLPRSNDRLSTKVHIKRQSLLILTVDDSESLRSANRAVIESCGYCAVTASNGNEAIAKLDSMQNLPDLILTDLEMPEMDGLELVAAIKADAQFARMPIVMVSSNNDPENQTRARRLGASGWVKKPLDRSNLASAVEEYLANRN